MINNAISNIISATLIFFGISGAPTAPAERLYWETAYNVTTMNSPDNILLSENKRIFSAEDLAWYKANSERNVNIVIRDYESMEVPVTVTLRKPITIEEFKILVDNYAININSFKGRAIDEFDSRVTLGGGPSETELVPLMMMEHFWNNPDYEVKGIVAFEGRLLVDKENIAKLQKDDSVYTVNMDSILVKKLYPSIKKMPVINDVYWHVEDYLNK